MKHEWFTLYHRKKTEDLPHLFIEIIGNLLILQNQRKSSRVKKITDTKTAQSLNEFSYEDVQIKGVAEQ